MPRTNSNAAAGVLWCFFGATDGISVGCLSEFVHGTDAEFIANIFTVFWRQQTAATITTASAAGSGTTV